MIRLLGIGAAVLAVVLLGVESLHASTDRSFRSREVAQGGGVRTTVIGTDAGDRLRGSGAGELLVGLRGPDSIVARGGADVVLGGSGADRIWGGAGADRLIGGAGPDRIVAGPGRDVVVTRDGQRDVVACGSGTDRAVVDAYDEVKSDCEQVTYSHATATGLELEGGRYARRLVGPGTAPGSWKYWPTGRLVPFLPRSDMNVVDPSGRYLFTSHESATDAGVTRVDLLTHEVEVLVQGSDFQRLDGLTWTPWDTLLVGEEAESGRLFEITNPTGRAQRIEVVERPAFGRRRHEGLAVDARGRVYGVDDSPEGRIYRLTPDRPLADGSLSHGTLEALAVRSVPGGLPLRRERARWVPIDSPAVTSFDRPEDVELVGTRLYVAMTGEDRVLSIDLARDRAPLVSTYLDRRSNAPELRSPDNLASDPSGNLYVAEDVGSERLASGRRNRIWLADAPRRAGAAARRVRLFGTVGRGDAEPTGLFVDATGRSLYVNLMGGDDLVLVVPIG